MHHRGSRLAKNVTLLLAIDDASDAIQFTWLPGVFVVGLLDGGYGFDHVLFVVCAGEHGDFETGDVHATCEEGVDGLLRGPALLDC